MFNMGSDRGLKRPSDLLSMSWSEFKANFKDILKFVSVFVGIPTLIITFGYMIWSFTDQVSKQLYLSPSLYAINPPPIYPFLTVAFILVFVGLLFNLFTSAGLVATSLKSGKYKFESMIKEAKGFYFRYLGFTIIGVIFLLALGILLIIPAVIFGVYWVVATYFLYEGKHGIIGSFGASFRIVRKRWWKVFGRLIIVLLVITVFSIIASIPLSIFNMISLAFGIGEPFPIWNVVLQNLLGIVDTIIKTLGTALMIIYFKNLYLDLKKTKPAK